MKFMEHWMLICFIVTFIHFPKVESALQILNEKYNSTLFIGEPFDVFFYNRDIFSNDDDSFIGLELPSFERKEFITEWFQVEAGQHFIDTVYENDETTYTLVHSGVDFSYFFDSSSQRITVFDTSDPFSVTKRGNCHCGHSGISCLFSSGSFLFATCGSCGFKIYDVSDPDLPFIAGEFENGWIFSQIHVIDDVLYATLDGTPGLATFNISNKTNPVLIDSGGTNSLSRSLFVDPRGYAYVGDYLYGFRVWDVRDVSNIGVQCAEETTYFKSIGVESDNDLLFIAEELMGLVLYNISVPCSPIFLSASGKPFVNAQIRAVGASGSYAFMADEHRGMHVYGVRDGDTGVFIDERVGEYTDVVKDIHWRKNTVMLADFLGGLKIYEVGGIRFNGTASPSACGDTFNVTILASDKSGWGEYNFTFRVLDREQGEDCVWNCYGMFSNQTSGACSDHGVCFKDDLCVCTSNETDFWYGEVCNITKCFGIPSDNYDAVCSDGFGQCVSLDHCMCTELDSSNSSSAYFNSFYANESICYAVHSCFGIMSNESAVCSNGQGDCTGYNFCECKDGYLSPLNTTLDQDCSSWECFEVRYYETSSCNGHGNCTSPDVCECELAYLQESGEQDCGKWTCFDKLRTSDAVCSNHGSCFDYDDCHCFTTDYTGFECHIWTCDEISANDDGVCSYHGNCEDVNICDCFEGYNTSVDGTYECDIWFCSGIEYNDYENLCSGMGNCTSPNNCECYDNYISGDDGICEQWKCDTFFHTQTDFACSGKGVCLSPDLCECNDTVAAIDPNTGEIVVPHSGNFGKFCEIIMGKQIVRVTQSILVMLFEAKIEHLRNYYGLDIESENYLDENGMDRSFRCSRFISVLNSYEDTKLEELFSGNCSISSINEFSVSTLSTHYLKIHVGHITLDDYIEIMKRYNEKLRIQIYGKNIIEASLYPPISVLESKKLFTMRSFEKPVDTDEEHLPKSESEICKMKLHVGDKCMKHYQCHKAALQNSYFEYYSIGYYADTTSSRYSFAKIYFPDKESCEKGEKFRQFKTFSPVSCSASDYDDKFYMYDRCADDVSSIFFESGVILVFLITSIPMYGVLVLLAFLCCCCSINLFLFFGRRCAKNLGCWVFDWEERSTHKEEEEDEVDEEDDLYVKNTIDVEVESNDERELMEKDQEIQGDSVSRIENDNEEVIIDDIKTDSSSSSSSEGEDEECEDSDDGLRKRDLQKPTNIFISRTEEDDVDRKSDIEEKVEMFITENEMSFVKDFESIRKELSCQKIQETKEEEEEDNIIHHDSEEDNNVNVIEMSFKQFYRDSFSSRVKEFLSEEIEKERRLNITSSPLLRNNDTGNQPSETPISPTSRFFVKTPLSKMDRTSTFIFKRKGKKKGDENGTSTCKCFFCVWKCCCCCCCTAFYPCFKDFLKCLLMVCCALIKEGYVIWISIAVYLSILFVMIVCYVHRFMFNPMMFSIGYGSLKEYVYYRTFKATFLTWFICVNLFCYIVKFRYLDEFEQENSLRNANFWFSIIFPETLLIFSLIDVLNYNGVSSHSHFDRLKSLGLIGMSRFPKVNIGMSKVGKDVDQILEDFFQLIFLIEKSGDHQDNIDNIDQDDNELKEEETQQLLEKRDKEGMELISELSGSDEYGHLSWEYLDNLDFEEILYLKQFFFPREFKEETYSTVFHHHRISSKKWIISLFAFPVVCLFGCNYM